MPTMPKPDEPSESFSVTYDAWSRMIELTEGDATVEVHRYDGAGRRIALANYDQGQLDHTRHFHRQCPQSVAGLINLMGRRLSPG